MSSHLPETSLQGNSATLHKLVLESAQGMLLRDWGHNHAWVVRRQLVVEPQKVSVTPLHREVIRLERSRVGLEKIEPLFCLVSMSKVDHEPIRTMMCYLDVDFVYNIGVDGVAHLLRLAHSDFKPW